MYEIQNNILSIIIALILYFSLKSQIYRSVKLNRLFFIILWSTIVVLILESIYLGMSGVPGNLARIILVIALILYHAISPAVVFLSAVFLDFEIYKNQYQFKKRHIIYIFVVVSSVILSILSLKGQYLFDIETYTNIYSPGPLRLWYASSIYVVAFISFIVTAMDARHLTKADITPLVLFISTPSIAMAFLLVYKETNLIWNALIISLLISYIYMQLKLTKTDYLTGLFNRREFETQLARVKNNSNKSEKIYGIIIDLDDFKQINDVYGHNEGDKALIRISDILQSSVRTKDFVSRIGGDEFAIILSAQDEAVVENVIKRIIENINDLNKQSRESYLLKISYGYDFYDEDKFETVIDFFNHVDLKMYRQKHQITDKK